jgi:hypothetical protein
MPGYDARYNGPFNHAVAITPNDSTDLATTAQAIYVGGAGALKVITAGGDTVTFAAVPAGTTLRLRVTRVFSTGTAATSIVGLY